MRIAADVLVSRAKFLHRWVGYDRDDHYGALESAGNLATPKMFSQAVMDHRYNWLKNNFYG